VQPLLILLAAIGCDAGLARPGVEFKVFQFPADKIPRIDGNPGRLVPGAGFLRDWNGATAGNVVVSATNETPPIWT